MVSMLTDRKGHYKQTNCTSGNMSAGVWKIGALQEVLEADGLYLGQRFILESL